MGNKIGRKRQVVDEKYTRPQGLYQHRDIDYKKLRKLILESKLAPCYPGLEEYAFDLEECPICFLCYPSLNRSRCCMKGICTECFLQMKPPHLTRPTQCPFCKTSNYAVEYRGAKTKEEKGHEEVEEQKVIEAQIRIHQQELQDEAERMKKRQDTSLPSMIMHPTDVHYQDTNSASISVPSLESTRQPNEYGLPQVSYAAQTSALPSESRQNRDHNFDLDLEDIMVMEAIWLSIQEQGPAGNPSYVGTHLPGPSASGGWYNSHGSAPVRLSPSSGLACAAAALAERQHLNAELTRHVTSTNRATCSAPQQSGNSSAENVRSVQNNSAEQWIEISPDSGRKVSSEEFRECLTDQWSEVADAGTSYAGSENTVEPGGGSTPIPLPDGTNMAPGHFLPESFEEQMMLAMAVSLAEARARTSDHGVSWL